MSFLFRIKFISFVILAVSGSYLFASERTVRLATLEWAPYAGKQIRNNGFTSEIVTQVFKRAGYKTEISFMPWARVLVAVEKGMYDAMYPAYYSKERDRIYALSKPFSNGPLGFIKRVDDKIQFKSLSDLKPYKIGVVRGYVNTAEFEAADYLIKEVVNNDKVNLKILLAGRIDLAVIDKFTFYQLISTSVPEGAGKLEFMEPPLEIKDLYVGFSRKIRDHQKLLEDFNHALEEMTELGIVNRIMEKQDLK
ncbi:MAG: transporter substrate-binding domain-containing protein [Desulfobacteraceae bacterium]|nr:transporter substrate-binding domain-containing protein [Desulfobacteraceae bacterium]